MLDNHPLVVFSGSACHSLTEEISQYVVGADEASPTTDAQPPIGLAKVRPHPNGEGMVYLDSDVRDTDAFVVVSVCHRHAPSEGGYTGVNDNLMELLLFGETLARASAHRITAVIPCFGYARQDRKAAGRTPITAKLVADLIATAAFNRVLTMDLHADQIQGFFSRTLPLDHLNAGKIITTYLTEHVDLSNAVVLSPDAGNLKKADKYRRGLPSNVGLAVVDKQRDVHGHVTSARITGDSIRGKTVLLLDDMISTAGTMRNAIDLALSSGAKEFYLAATHPEFVGRAVERLSHPAIKEIIVTNTIPLLPGVTEKLPITVLSVGALFGEAIYRIHVGESISKLLGVFC